MPTQDWFVRNWNLRNPGGQRESRRLCIPACLVPFPPTRLATDKLRSVAGAFRIDVIQQEGTDSW